MTKPTIEEQLYKAIEALSFYADVDTYFAISIFSDPPCGEFAQDFDKITEVNDAGEVIWETYKPGKRARETLLQLIEDPQVMQIVEHFDSDEDRKQEQNA